MMMLIPFADLVDADAVRAARVRNDFPGFREDYLVLHRLIRFYRPQSFIEIGTSTGVGTAIICHAMRLRRFWFNRRVVYSIDVPPGSDPDVLYPDHEDGHPQRAGCRCHYPYRQLFGNSMHVDFSAWYPLEGWFIDGKHSADYARADTESALKAEPKVIVWHDMQIDGVRDGVLDAMSGQSERYLLCRVPETRMAFAVRRDCPPPPGCPAAAVHPAAPGAPSRCACSM